MATCRTPSPDSLLRDDDLSVSDIVFPVFAEEYRSDINDHCFLEAQVPTEQDAQRQIWLDDDTKRCQCTICKALEDRYARSIIQLVSRQLAGHPC